MGLRVQLEEDDDMTESQLTNKAGFRGADGKIRRRGSPIPRKLGGGPRGVKTLVAGSSEWYQVMVSVHYHVEVETLTSIQINSKFSHTKPSAQSSNLLLLYLFYFRFHMVINMTRILF